MRYRLPLAAFFIAAVAQADIASVIPATACNYLASNGLPTTTYRQQADGSYRCGSPHIDIGTVPGKSGRMNNIAYTVTGRTQAIDALQLTIDVDNPDQAAAIHRRLKDVAKALAHKLDAELSSAVEEAIASGSTIKDVSGKHTISVVRTDRPTGGYEIKVIFE